MLHLSGSGCIRGTDVTRVDLSVPLIYRKLKRSWITDPDSDHPKGTHPEYCDSSIQVFPRQYHFSLDKIGIRCR